MILRDGGKITYVKEKVADTFNRLFVNIENTLKIDKDRRFLVGMNDVFDFFQKQLRNVAFILAFLASKKK